MFRLAFINGSDLQKFDLIEFTVICLAMRTMFFAKQIATSPET